MDVMDLAIRVSDLCLQERTDEYLHYSCQEGKYILDGGAIRLCFTQHFPLIGCFRCESPGSLFSEDVAPYRLQTLNA